MIFQIGSKNGGYFLAPLRTFSVLKFLKDINTLMIMVIIWFRLTVQKYYFSFQDFKIPGFSVGTLFSHRWIQFIFPTHLANEFKVKWWSNFVPSNAHQIPSIRQWIFSKNSSLKPSSSKVSLPLSLYAILLSRTYFSSDKEYKRHLKLLKKKASETLSRFSNSGSDDDTTSFTFLGDVNEDMCYGLPYTPLGWCIQDAFKLPLQSSLRAIARFTYQKLHSWYGLWCPCSWHGLLSP